MNGNDYGYGNGGMSDDSFNVFNQNAEAYKQQQELLKQQAAQAQQAAIQQQQVLAAQHEQNKLQPTITTEKKSFLSSLLTKKPKKNERVFDLNDPSTYSSQEKEHKEIDEKQKNKIELILLFVLIIILGVVVYWAVNVFSTTLGMKRVDTTPSPVHTEPIKIDGYSCKTSIDKLYFAVPYPELIDNNLSSYTVEYFSSEDTINLKVEKILINYGYLDDYKTSVVTKFCNSYNLINDDYQVICDLKYSVMTITNRFDLNKIDGTVKNGDIEYKLNENNNSVLVDVVNEKSSLGYNCSQIQNDK
jgi:hypothetical protein